MANRASLQDIAQLMSEKTGRTKQFSDQFVRQFFAIIRDALLRESYVKVKGLGTFKLIMINERESVDVSSGERIEISAHHRLSFTPDKEIAQRINRPFEDFETVLLEEEGASQPAGAEPVLMEVPAVAAVDDSTQDIQVQTIRLEDAKVDAEPAPAEEETVFPTQGEGEPEQADAHEEVTDDAAEQGAEMTDEEVYEEETDGRRWLKSIVLCILAILLFIGGYFAGYYKIFDTILKSNVPVAEQNESTESQPQPIFTDSVTVQTDSLSAQQEDTVRKGADETGRLLEESKNYEQMPQAEYLIVGTLDTHQMQEGESLIRLSQKYYGDKDMYKYVIFYNHITNPDIVHVGAEIKFPKLVKSPQ